MRKWWDEYAAEDAEKPEAERAPKERHACSCGWEGVPIDHPKIDPLLCGHCLKGIPGTERRREIATCPECGSRRLTPDDSACLDCDWPELAPDPEPTTERPEDLE